jgi:7tm Chemosensory receptor
LFSIPISIVMEVTLHFSMVSRIFQSFGTQAPKTQSDKIHCGLTILAIIALFTTVLISKFEPFYRLDGSGFATVVLKFLSLYSTVLWLSFASICRNQNCMDAILLKIDEINGLFRQLCIDTHTDNKKLAEVFSKRFLTAMICSLTAVVLEVFEGRLSVFGYFVFKFCSLLINLKVWQAIMHVWIHQYLLLTLRDALRQLNTNLGYNEKLKNQKYRACLIGRCKLLMRLYSSIHDYTDLINAYFGHSLFSIMQYNIMQSTTFFYWAIHDLYKLDLPIYHYVGKCNA